MSGATMDPSDLPPNSPTPAVEAPVNQVRPPAARTRTPSAPPATTPPPTRGAGRPQATPPANRAAIIIGGILLAILLFVIGFFAGHSSTGSNDLQATTISVIKNVDPSIVQVQGSGNGPGSSVGSGEILTSDGYIVTNSHVVHGQPNLGVLLANGNTVPARLVADLPSQDLAVIKINGSGLQPVSVADSSQVQVGQSAIAMGSPLGLEQSSTTGIVSALNREAQERVGGNVYTLTGMIQTSAPINPGNSGGALVNLEGQLIGIPTLAAVDPTTGAAANGIGFAISSNQMEKIVAPYVPTGS
jgi:S1-C subfamily serine protease